MDINAETFRKSQTWAVIVPVVLLLVALTMTLGLFDSKAKAEAAVNRTSGVVKVAGQIIELRRRAAADGSAAREIRPFDTVNSALEAAASAGIGDKKIHRGASPSPTRQKDGAFQYRETYKINQVMMFQIAAFIDYAERNFESLRCTDISIIPSPDLKNKDSWDVNVNFIYIRR